VARLTVRLLQQPTVEAAQNALEVALEAELDMVYGDIPEWEFALLRSGGKRLISEWIKREFMARDLWPKDGQTIKVDSRFGDGRQRQWIRGRRAEQTGRFRADGATGELGGLSD